MAIPDPLIQTEPLVETEEFGHVPTREWYSWFETLVREIRGELVGVRTDITAIQATLADHEARITALEPP